MYDSQNVFARILRGELPCQKIAEDEFFLAFHDRFPKAPIHGLIIPKGEFKDSFAFHTSAPQDLLVGFYQGVGKVCDILGVNKDGYRLISNAGLNGGQEVPHYHIHILAGRHLGPMVS